MTLFGVCLVILEKSQKVEARKLAVKRMSWGGVIYGLGAMLGQAGGFVLSKAGMQTESGYLDAFSATQIRAIAAFFCFVLFFTFTNRWQEVGSALRNRKALLFTAIGAFLGVFLGVSLSLMALHYLETGVAATFLSLVPISIIPFSIYVNREYVSIRAFGGAVIAVFGVFLLMN